MARLPQPGGDAGNWGDILNNYLQQSHNTDGTLKAGIIGDDQITADAITEAKLAPAVRTKLNATGGTTTSVNMGGHITGTSDNAQIVAGAVGASQLANGAVTAAKIVDGTITESKLDAAVVAKLNAAGSGTIADGSITAAKLNAGSGTNGQVLVLDSTAVGGFRWQTVSSGSSNPTGAAGGALAGTYPNPSLAASAVTTTALADGAVTVTKISSAATPVSGQVLTYSGSGLTWTTPATGGSSDPTVGGDLSGTASNAQIVAGAVGATEIANSAVTNAKLADDAVAGAKLANDAVATAKIADEAVTEAKLAVSNSPSANQVLSWNGTQMAWATPATGGGNGMPQFTYRTVTTDTTAANGECLLVNTSAQGIMITLPQPVANAYIRIKRNDSNHVGNSIQVQPPSGSTLDGGYYGTATLNNPYQSQEFWSDGVNWYR